MRIIITIIIIINRLHTLIIVVRIYSLHNRSILCRAINLHNIFLLGMIILQFHLAVQVCLRMVESQSVQTWRRTSKITLRNSIRDYLSETRAKVQSHAIRTPNRQCTTFLYSTHYFSNMHVFICFVMGVSMSKYYAMVKASFVIPCWQILQIK